MAQCATRSHIAAKCLKSRQTPRSTILWCSSPNRDSDRSQRRRRASPAEISTANRWLLLWIFLAIALSALAGISERRIERLVNPALSEGLPPFLAEGAGLNSGFMMAQVTAAALVSENKVLAHPASVDSITTSGNKEDYVSMGMTAANKLRRIVENTRNVLAIEAMAVAQAIDFLAPLKTSKRGQAAHAAIRAVCPTMEKDRVMYKDFARIAELIASGKVAEALS